MMGAQGPTYSPRDNSSQSYDNINHFLKSAYAENQNVEAKGKSGVEEILKAIENEKEFKEADSHLMRIGFENAVEKPKKQ